MSRSPGQAVFRAVRVALRDLDPLGVGNETGAYDAPSARAAQILVNGGTGEEAAEVVAEMFFTDLGVTLGRRKRRQLATRLRVADPRLKLMRFPRVHRVPKE